MTIEFRKLEGGPRFEKLITFCEQRAKVACDGRCEKAFGSSTRPKVQLSDDPDDYAFLGDAEVGDAPQEPGTSEGGHLKPLIPVTNAEQMNKWCVRECERCSMSSPGEADQPLELRRFYHACRVNSTEQKGAMTDDEIKHAISLAKCYLTGGNSPPLRTDTTPKLAHAALALHAEVEKMRPVYDLARRWCNRPESVLREGGEVFANDAELWIELRKRIAAAALVESTR